MNEFIYELINELTLPERLYDHAIDSDDVWYGISKNFRVRIEVNTQQKLFNAEIFTRACGSVILEAQDFRAAWKSTKELVVSEATMNKKYWLRFLPCLQGQPLALADVLTAILRNPEDYPLTWSSFELTLRMRTSMSRAFKTAVLCAHWICSFHTIKCTLV